MTPTPFEKVFERFFSSPVVDRDYELYTDEDVRQELTSFLYMAIMKFKNSAVPLDYEGDSFLNELTENEINVLVALMKHEWTKKFINDDYHLKQRPSFRDVSFSASAPHLKQLQEREKRARDEAYEAINWYSRSLSNFAKLGGKQ